MDGHESLRKDIIEFGKQIGSDDCGCIVYEYAMSFWTLHTLDCKEYNATIMDNYDNQITKQ
jgi:hypothetical protein